MLRQVEPRDILTAVFMRGMVVSSSHLGGHVKGGGRHASVECASRPILRLGRDGVPQCV